MKNSPATSTVKEASKELEPEDRKKIEDATVFIQVKDPSWSATGVGFFAMEPGVILTSAAILRPFASRSKEPEAINVSAFRGTANQRELSGTLLCVDNQADIALIRVNPEGMPPPLKLKWCSVYDFPKSVYLCVYAQGGAQKCMLTKGQPSRISQEPSAGWYSDRMQVAIDGTVGGLGGPVLDETGDVVGILLAGVTGTKLCVVTCSKTIYDSSGGHIASVELGQPYRDVGHVAVPVSVELIDPFERIEKVEVEVFSANDNPKHGPGPSLNSAPPTKPGESQRIRYALEVRGSRALGNIALPELAPGQTYWWQPVLTYKDPRGESVILWYDGARYQPDEPVIKRQVLVSRQNVPAKCGVSLDIKQRFSFLDWQGVEHYFLTDITSALAERWASSDERGSRTLILDVKKCDMGLEVNPGTRHIVEPGQVLHNIPILTLIANLKVRQISKARALGVEDSAKERVPDPLIRPSKIADFFDLKLQASPEVRRALDNIKFLEMTASFSDDGKALKKTVDAKEAPADVRWRLESIGEVISSALMALEVRFGNRPVSAGQTWKSTYPFPMVSLAETKQTNLELLYTYFGARNRKGREEGVVGIKGTALKQADKGIRSCDVNGRACVDVLTGTVTEADVSINVDLDTFFQGNPARAKGIVNMRLRRELPTQE